MPMKILHVAEVGRGGVITVMDSLIAAQARLPEVDRIFRLCPAESTCIPDPKLCELRYRRTGRNLTSQLALVIALARVLVREEPDIVHLHSTFAGLWGRPLVHALMPRASSVVVYTPHAFSFLPPSRMRPLYVLVERALARYCGAIVCVSEHERAAAVRHGLPGAKLHLIRNGVAAQADAEKADDDRLRVLFVGRFDHQKGFDVLQRALAHLGPRESIAVRAVGAPDRDGGFQPGFSSGLECLGWLDEREVQAQYRWADVVVVPSRWEAFAMVPLEAMSFGCAVIASDCCSLPEAVEDGSNGRLFPAEDAMALARILDEGRPTVFREMGRAGAKRQRREFQLPNMIDATTALYRDLVAANGRRGAEREDASPEPSPDEPRPGC